MVSDSAAAEIYMSSRIPPQFETSGLMMSTARADDRTEARAREQRLAGDDRNAARLADLRERLDILGLAGLFEPIGLEFRERPGEINGVHRRQASVYLNENIDVVTDRVADRARHPYGAPDMVLRHVSSPGARKRVELQRREAA